MKASDVELGSLLKLERRHLIPTYQRDYEWTEDGQWQLLTDDVLDLASRLSHARSQAGDDESARRIAEERVGPHFLGAVVLEALPQQGAKVSACSVIDGQQRLTTVHLLLRGLLDLLTEHGLSKRERQVRKWIHLDAGDVDEAEEVFKLWPRRRDREEWQRVMSDPLPETDHKYGHARRFFRDRFAAELEGLSAVDAQAFLEHLVDALHSKVKIVVVDLENTDDAQLIFEVLNGRQTPLSAADLVKNLLFMRGGIQTADLDKLYDKYWAPFDDKWWAEKVGRGHAARGRRDQLIATWLTIRTADEVNTGRLYGEARSYLSTLSEPIDVILRDIAELAQEYHSIYDHDDDDPPVIAAAYRRIERLGVTTAIPLLAWLRLQLRNGLSQDGHQRAIEAIDSYVMRRLIVSAQTRNYTKVFLDVLTKAQQANGLPVAEVITQALLAEPAGEPWPTDDDLRNEFVHRGFYGRMNQERIRMILGPIDRHMQRQDKSIEFAEFDYDALTIEHILPREWAKHWPVGVRAQPQRTELEKLRESRVHRLGNLTLITPYLNSSVSNGAWRTKRAALKKRTALALNRFVHEAESWDENAIDARGEALAVAACQVWKRPA